MLNCAMILALLVSPTVGIPSLTTRAITGRPDARGRARRSFNEA